MSLLDGKVAIVTGGASGIGRAIAIRFAAEGAIVVVADTREDPIEGGEPTVAEIRRTGKQALFWPADVARWADIDRLVAQTAEMHGRLDVMVNNAAIYTGTRLTETTEEQWNRVMAVNLTGMFFGCKRAV
jgi:glucose 1-dehydrogenase